MERADIAIIGTGPAGVSAAITAKVRGKTVLLFGSRELSSKLTKAHKIQNYPGLPDIDGAQLAQAFKKHLDVLEIPITEKQVTAVYAMGSYFGIQTPDAMLEASSVILAGGVVMGKPFPKEDELLGRGVSYCATCDAHFYPGKTVAVLGYNAESCREAHFLAEPAGRLLCRSLMSVPLPFWARPMPKACRRSRIPMRWMVCLYCGMLLHRTSWCRGLPWRGHM